HHVLGIANMRGDIVSVFDLAALTIDEPMATVNRPNLIQVDYEDTTVCFAVAEPPNSLTIPVDTIKKQASNPPADPNGLVAEYVELGEHLIQIIPVDRLLAHRALVQLISSYSAE
ncbi:MAG: hypothetical protein CL946_03095, partial [Ectothiorhodospiraceae bacterium]|nr:hypothetical protein [Ectothiorhodospiraceae bacterium]